MRQIITWLKHLFFPPPGTSRSMRTLPYAILVVLALTTFTIGGAVWEYTNSPTFCGTVCHTMPPEYTAYLTSPHARVACVECHLGRGYIATNITRKAGDIKHIIALAFKEYKYPIRAKEMRPARETCERCHYPEKFSDDSLREIKHFGEDPENTPSSTYLILKTGGGSKRLGLGRGIHWHIENQIDYLALGPEEQEVPYIRVINDDGSITEYIDITVEIDSTSINLDDLREMDCITCHNRISHLVHSPEEIVDQLLAREVISASIPDIRRQSVEILYRSYESSELALNAIAGLNGYYQDYYPDYYAENGKLIADAIATLQNTYTQSVFPEQKFDWNSHPNNIGHQNTPGCFRCHDGKHMSADDVAIRLECNLCHSIPVVAGTTDFVTDIEISRGAEPDSHLHPNWISMHHDAFNPTCSNCHSTDDPGGTSNTSFCSNSACHGNVFEYAGFDAPELRKIVLEQLPPTPVPLPPIGEGPNTYQGSIGALLQERCGSCHGENGIQSLNLTTYETTMAGGINGPVVLPGDPKNSRLVQEQSGEIPHFGQLSPDELDLVIEWITAGATEQ